MHLSLCQPLCVPMMCQIHPNFKWSRIAKGISYFQRYTSKCETPSILKWTLPLVKSDSLHWNPMYRNEYLIPVILLSSQIRGSLFQIWDRHLIIFCDQLYLGQHWMWSIKIVPYPYHLFLVIKLLLHLRATKLLVLHVPRRELKGVNFAMLSEIMCTTNVFTCFVSSYPLFMHRSCQGQGFLFRKETQYS
jgi:hypothetical protein